MLQVGTRPVQEDVVPDSRSSRPARDPAHRPLQLDDDGNRQARPVSLGQKAGSDDRLLPFGGSRVGHKEVLIGNLVTVPNKR